MAATLVFLSSAPAAAGRFNGVVITGASNADDGYQSDHLKDGRLEPILFTMFGIPINPDAGVDGRYSNGLSIPEWMYLELGFTFAETENYAIGAAQTGPGLIPSGLGFPLFLLGPERNWNDPNGQITRLLASHGGVLDPRMLYYVNIGGNDFNSILGSAPDETVTRTNLSDGYTRLAGAGARNFFVINQYTFGTGANPLNTILPELLQELRGTLGIEVIYFDTDSLSFAILANPAAFGFDPATAHLPCFVGGINSCTSEQAAERFNWDGLHLTAAANAVIGRAQAHLIVAPETHGAVILPAFGHMTSLRSQITGRLNRLRMAKRGANEILIADASSDLSRYNLDAREGEAGIFLRTEYGDFRRGATSLDPVLDGHGFTATLGADYDVAPSLRVGIAAGYGESSSTIAGSDSSEMSSYALSLYGMWMGGESGGRFRPVIEFASAIARLDVETRRDVGFAGLSAYADTGGWHYAASAKAGLDMVFDAVTVTPEFGIAWQEAKLDSYTEAGAPAGFNMAVGEQRQTSLASELGGSLASEVGRVRPSLALHWIHEFESAARTVVVAPDSYPGLPFTAHTGEADSDYGRAQFLLAGDIGDAVQLEVGYRRTFLRDDWSEQTFHLEFRFPF